MNLNLFEIFCYEVERFPIISIEQRKEEKQMRRGAMSPSPATARRINRDLKVTESASSMTFASLLYYSFE